MGDDADDLLGGEEPCQAHKVGRWGDGDATPPEPDGHWRAVHDRTAGGRNGTIRRLIGVYDADNTVSGELAYVVGAALGRRHCGLCSITHGALGERPVWKQCRARLPVPFDTHHRNDQPAAVRAAATAPAVVAELDDGALVPLLDGAALDACNRSPDAMADAIDRARTTHGLAWPD